MGQEKIKSIRRRELVQATISAIFQYGFADLTIAQIAEDADVSTGNIHYYFGGKDALLEATMRHIMSLLNTAYQRRLVGLEDSVDRIHAVVQSNFDETVLTSETCRVWIQFWAFAPYNPSLARLQNLNRSRVRSNIISPLRNLLPPQNIESTASAIQAYMDGIWVQTAQNNKAPDLDTIQREAMSFTELALGSGALKKVGS